MKIILSKQCESLTGMLNSSLGYHIKKQKNGFFSKRNQRGIVPPDGHWRMILTCAQLAQSKLHIADIRVSREELKQAMYEARIFIAMQHLRKATYDARDIINLKITFGL